MDAKKKELATEDSATRQSTNTKKEPAVRVMQDSAAAKQGLQKPVEPDKAKAGRTVKMSEKKTLSNKKMPQMTFPKKAVPEYIQSQLLASQLNQSNDIAAKRIEKQDMSDSTLPPPKFTRKVKQPVKKITKNSSAPSVQSAAVKISHRQGDILRKDQTVPPKNPEPDTPPAVVENKILTDEPRVNYATDDNVSAGSIIALPARVEAGIVQTAKPLENYPGDSPIVSSPSQLHEAYVYREIPDLPEEISSEEELLALGRQELGIVISSNMASSRDLGVNDEPALDMSDTYAADGRLHDYEPVISGLLHELQEKTNELALAETPEASELFESVVVVLAEQNSSANSEYEESGTDERLNALEEKLTPVITEIFQMLGVETDEIQVRKVVLLLVQKKEIFRHFNEQQYFDKGTQERMSGIAALITRGIKQLLEPLHVALGRIVLLAHSSPRFLALQPA